MRLYVKGSLKAGDRLSGPWRDGEVTLTCTAVYEHDGGSEVEVGLDAIASAVFPHNAVDLDDLPDGWSVNGEAAAAPKKRSRKK